MNGRCNLAAVPMRSEPSDKSEMVNQVLFGETFSILNKNEKWSKIKLQHDRYEGWIDNKQYIEINSQQSKIKHKNVISTLFTKKKNAIFPLGSYVDFTLKENNHTILQTATLFLNTPYLWGGRTFMGIDCSGFTQVVFRIHGINLFRDAYQQATQGKKITLKNTKNGDLAFFKNASGKIIHVGIVFIQNKTTQIIHASGKVRIDLLDEAGIYNRTLNSYSHQLECIKRVLK